MSPISNEKKACPHPGCKEENEAGASQCARCGGTLDGVGAAQTEVSAEPTAGDQVPALAADATPEEKDAHWFRHVYQGDHVPQLTFRAVVMGGVIGMAMCCAHLYTVLAIGWSFGVAITACVMSYVIWSLMRRFSGGKLTPMSILENNCMQSTASAAGYSTGSTLATCFGALLLLTAAPTGGTDADVKTWEQQPIWVIATFTFLTGSLGVFLAIPIKRQLINHEQLPFPSGIAAAATLKSLYSKGAEAMRKAYSLVAALPVAMIWGLLKTDPDTAARVHFGNGRSLQAVFEWIKAKLFGVSPDPRGGHAAFIPDLIPEAGFAAVASRPLFRFGFEPSFLLIAAGMIVGLRVSLSMLAGSLLLYLVVSPALIDMDQRELARERAATQAALVEGGGAASNSDGDQKEYVISIPFRGGSWRVTTWALWGGTSVMVCASLTALALQWRTVLRSFSRSRASGSSAQDEAMRRIEVPTSWFVGGVVPICLALILLLHFAFEIPYYFGLIAVAMAFVLSMVAARATGETDTTPTGAMGKVMQLAFAGLQHGKIVPNLVSAGAAANSASSASDLLTDLKSGYVLGANPKRQFLAQFIGVFFGTVAILPCWYLMVPTKAALDKYTAPATRQWQAVAEILTKGLDRLPQSAVIAIIVGAALGIAFPLIERKLPKSAKPYFPSAMGLGLSWVVPFSNALSFSVGAAIAWLWGLVHKRSHDSFKIPIASGLVAGESLALGVIAMLATAIYLLEQQGWWF